MSRLSGKMYQETSELNVQIYWQQQASDDRMKTGFDHAERRTEAMNRHLVNLHLKMDRQISMFEIQMRRLQNITGSNIIRTLGGGISSIQRQDNTSMTNREYIAKVDNRLENLTVDIRRIDKKLDDLLCGIDKDMEELKNSCVMILIKIDKMGVGGLPKAAG